MTGQRIAETLVDAFVDQDAHLGTREQQMFCFFESSDSGFTRYGGKSLEKLFDCFSSFQIVEESLDWHSRSAKHRSSAKNIRIFDDNSHDRTVSRMIMAGRGFAARFAVWRPQPVGALGRKFFRLDQFLKSTSAKAEENATNPKLFP